MLATGDAQRDRVGVRGGPKAFDDADLSTVIVGFLDADDALHEASVARVRELSCAHGLAASVITYAEVMTGARLGHHEQDTVVGFFDTLIRELLPVDRLVADRAADIRGKRRSVRMPDALILATAELQEEIELVLCGDADWPKLRGIDCRVELVCARVAPVA